jgi:hypothetical protein
VDCKPCYLLNFLLKIDYLFYINLVSKAQFWRGSGSISYSKNVIIMVRLSGKEISEWSLRWRNKPWFKSLVTVSSKYTYKFTYREINVFFHFY